MRLNRRETLALGASLAVAACASRTGSPTDGSSSLNDLARRSGRRFGSAVGAGRPGAMSAFRDPAYRSILVRECGLLVMENELKWGSTRPAPDRFDFSGADRLLAFAEENDLAMRGHTLLWHHSGWFPAWVASHDFGSRPAAAAEKMVREHVATICRRYGKRIHGYDVVNEAVDADTGAMRETAFSRAIGSAEDVLDIAFRTARETAPHAQLVYNDYMSWEPGNEAHRGGVLRLLEALKRRGTPVDALGVQAHIGTANTDTSTGFGIRQEAEWRRFLDAVTGMGYDLVITEFDVHDKGLPADIAGRDRAVADYARAYLDLMLSYRQLGDVVAWGMVDKYSWLQERWARPDGLPKRPTPYDAEYRPKPLREAIAAAFANASSRHG